MDEISLRNAEYGNWTAEYGGDPLRSAQNIDSVSIGGPSVKQGSCQVWGPYSEYYFLDSTHLKSRLFSTNS